MLEILDIPDLREQMAPISIEKYHHMIESGVFDDWDVELLSGVLVRKVSKSELHIYITDLFVDLVRTFCSQQEFDLWVRKEDPITIKNSEPEPDLSVVEGLRSDYRVRKPSTARFVAEVAITSYNVDLAKASDYALAGIPEYWIIRPADDQIEVYRKPKNGKYGEMFVKSADEFVESSSLEGFQFKLAEHL